MITAISNTKYATEEKRKAYKLFLKFVKTVEHKNLSRDTKDKLIEKKRKNLGFSYDK